MHDCTKVQHQWFILVILGYYYFIIAQNLI